MNRPRKSPPKSAAGPLQGRAAAALLELANHGAVLLDIHLRVVWANEAFGLFFDRPSSQLLDQPLLDLPDLADSTVAEILEHAQALGTRPILVDLVLEQTATLPRRILQLGLRRIDPMSLASPGEPWIAVLCRDVTERRRLESLGRAVNLSTNLGQLFSGIRHELGNPINSIKTALSVLRRNFDRFSRERIEQYFDSVTRELLRVEELLRSLRSLSAFEQPRLEPLDTEAFLERLWLLTSSDLERRGVTMELLVETDGRRVLADRRALLQVFFNLVNNALDALEGVAEPLIKISSRLDGEQIVFRVDDNGIGFDPEETDQLLQPFYTSKDEGTGLGLAICAKLVSSMSGSLAIQGALNAGCTVTVRLPAATLEHGFDSTSGLAEGERP